MFGRKKRDTTETAEAEARSSALDAEADEDLGADGADDSVDVADGTADPDSGPWSIEDREGEREEIAQGRLDLGSVLLPLPAGGQLQVEMTQQGTPQAVHIVTQHGRITVAAFAAPKSPGQWREVATELADTLRRDNASVSVESGPFGREVVGLTAGGELRFIGVDGYRWMIRGVATGPAGSVGADSPLVQQARAVVAGTIVDRGSDPHPVRTPLPVTLPQALAQQLAAAQQQQAAQQAAAQQAAAQQAAQQQAGQQQAGSPHPAPEPGEDPSAGGTRRGPSGSAMQQLG
ncbi:DUF3710 domain-containing protein [Rhodococcoides corynebacterioides]|uniref:DUF3710 domain-containing protein n=1 Tax=Rhodococcoides corynebacterioides TaxID=53972 RepID=A0ABS7P1Q3_9NOCA|nr:DUF3710 domain-containing protein [Rhodococcus corynebacterioides]MBY6366328.1 DUF3710 domain-containing protein [Rhodococcus corynebacterioides]MBY6406761.1 DUF3710 domain-containing protein [Rhodococcus corynebacterioides]